MNPDKPEQASLAPDGEQDNHDTWGSFEAELFGATNPADLDRARTELQRHETKIRRQEMLTRLYEFSDLLVRMPDDFPDKKYFEHVISATAKMLDPLTGPREIRLRYGIGDLERAIAILKPEPERYD